MLLSWSQGLGQELIHTSRLAVFFFVLFFLLCEVFTIFCACTISVMYQQFLDHNELTKVVIFCYWVFSDSFHYLLSPKLWWLNRCMPNTWSDPFETGTLKNMIQKAARHLPFLPQFKCSTVYTSFFIYIHV